MDKTANSPPFRQKPVQNRVALMVAAGLALAVLIVFWPVLSFDFVNYDDPEFITENVFVRRGLSMENFKIAWSATFASYWHPLTWLSHMADCQFFGLKPRGHHLVNILIHAL